MSRSSRSKYLGSIIPEMVGIVDVRCLDVVFQVIKRLNGRNAKQADEWVEHLKRIIDAGLPEGSFDSCTTTYPFTIDIDYGLTLEQMVSAGKYDSVNANITANHFPLAGEGKIKREVKLLHFNRVISSEAVAKEIDQAGYRQGKLEELLVLGATHPDLQRQFPIIAPGSQWLNSDGRWCVPCLSRHRWFNRRRLHLHLLVHDWDEVCHFLAVRN